MQYIIFGHLGEYTDKGIVGHKDEKTGMWTVSIYKLKMPQKTGDSWTLDDTEEKLCSLCFCTKESLDVFIKALMLIRGNMGLEEMKVQNENIGIGKRD